MLKRAAAFLLLIAGLMSLDVAAAQTPRPLPYWASIASGRAMMRTGPGQNYPGTWLYVRPDLPIRVVEVYRDWRKVSDPEGTTGWMLVRLLSDQRTAIVLREVDGLSYEEIAFSLGVAVGTVKSRLTRARQALREELLGLHR